MTFNVWLLMITGALAMSTAPMMMERKGRKPCLSVARYLLLYPYQADISTTFLGVLSLLWRGQKTGQLKTA